MIAHRDMACHVSTQIRNNGAPKNAKNLKFGVKKSRRHLQILEKFVLFINLIYESIGDNKVRKIRKKGS